MEDNQLFQNIKCGSIFFCRIQRALDLALKYNFVTDITSLVIIRPESSKIVAKKVEIISLDKDGSRYADLSPNFSAGSNDQPKSADYDYEILEDVGTIASDSPRFESTPKPKSKSKPKPNSEECELILFSKTYLRGESKTLTTDAKDLGEFDDKATSLEVRGQCCWNLFPDPNFEGEKKEFEPGQYKSSADMDELFRNVSSAQKINC